MILRIQRQMAIAALTVSSAKIRPMAMPINRKFMIGLTQKRIGVIDCSIIAGALVSNSFACAIGNVSSKEVNKSVMPERSISQKFISCSLC